MAIHHHTNNIFWSTWTLGLYSLSGRTSYRTISWSLEAARLGVIMIVSLWNLTGISAALLPRRCLSNLTAIGKCKTETRGCEFSRDLVVRHVCLIYRGPANADLVSIIGIDHDTVCAGVVGTAIRHSTSAVPDCSTNHSSADRISGQFLFYHDHNSTKSKGNLRFRRLVPLFVTIGVCVTTHDDGTASDVTIGMWRHNQQATNHKRNDKPWFSLSK